MRQRIGKRWGVCAGAVAAIGVAVAGRLAGLALGKAVAFGYAVVVSLAANFAIDFISKPADNLVQAALWHSPVRGVAEARATAPLPAPAARPGPGSGGLY